MAASSLAAVLMFAPAAALAVSLPVEGPELGKTQDTALGIFRLVTAAKQTYVTLKAPHTDKACLVVSVSQHMSKFHNSIGWELFRGLFSGHLNKAGALEMRKELVFKFRPVGD